MFADKNRPAIHGKKAYPFNPVWSASSARSAFFCFASQSLPVAIAKVCIRANGLKKDGRVGQATRLNASRDYYSST